MINLFRQVKDRNNLLNLVIIMLVLKIIGIMFVNYYARHNKTNQGLLFRDSEIMSKSPVNPAIMALGYHWDSIHYVNTSVYWIKHYRDAGDRRLRNLGFLYPAFIYLTDKVIKNSIQAGVLVANIFSILAVFAFYGVCRIYYDEEKSFIGSVLFLVYPSFFAAGLIAYSEPVYLFFAIVSWYFFEKERYLLSALGAGLALSSRTSGGIIIPIYILILLYQIISRSRKEKRLVLPKAGVLWFLILIFFAGFQAYLLSKIDSPGNAVALSGNMLQVFIKKINSHHMPILLPLEQIKVLVNDTGHGLDMYMRVIPAVLLGLYLRKTRPELAIYAIGAIFAVMCISPPGVIRAIPRHLLNAWPIFIAAGDLVKSRYFMGVLSSYFFLDGLKTLDWYFVCCYI